MHRLDTYDHGFCILPKNSRVFICVEQQQQKRTFLQWANTNANALHRTEAIKNLLATGLTEIHIRTKDTEFDSNSYMGWLTQNTCSVLIFLPVFSSDHFLLLIFNHLCIVCCVSIQFYFVLFFSSFFILLSHTPHATQ